MYVDDEKQSIETKKNTALDARGLVFLHYYFIFNMKI